MTLHPSLCMFLEIILASVSAWSRGRVCFGSSLAVSCQPDGVENSSKAARSTFLTAHHLDTVTLWASFELPVISAVICFKDYLVALGRGNSCDYSETG